MNRLSTVLLAGFAAACFSSGALAQTGTGEFVKSASSPAGAANQEAGLRLNTGSNEFAQFGVDTRHRAAAGATYSTASGPAPDGSMNPGFPSGDGSTSSLSALPSPLATGGFSVSSGSTGPASEPARPTLARQTAPLMFGLDTSQDTALAAGLSNDRTIGR